MPVIEVEKDDLLNLVGRKMSNEQIEETLFLLKCETEISGNTVSCEVNPDRPDMFSVEGIARAIKGYLDIGAPKKYVIEDSKVTLKGNSQVRPVIACATIEGITLTDELVRSLMQIQEKLCGSIGRERRKVAIGVHDLDKIKVPLKYIDMKPKEIKFIPLNDSREMDLEEILKQHPKGKDYAHLLEKWKIYPVIFDKEGVISFPPIINSERTKVTEKTRNLFIDVTGTDEKSVSLVLNILICNIVERSGKIGFVKISNKRYPRFETKKYVLKVEDIDNLLGLGLKESEIADCLKRMLYNVTKCKGGKIEIMFPPYRADIMHEVDIVEDIAMGYGYNNISPILPKLGTIGGLSKLEKFSTKLRELMVGMGFQETLNFVLTNEDNNFKKMRVSGEAVEILNPVSAEYTICRTWALPSLLKVLTANKHVEYPQRVFEVGEVIFLGDTETNTKTIRKLAGVISHDNANLTEMKSIIESILNNIGCKFEINPVKHNSFIEDRAGEIVFNGEPIGIFGEIHPEVLEKWVLERPVIGFEIEFERLL